MKIPLFFLTQICLYHSGLAAEDLYYGTFPAGFRWSTATSAYQIEGAWNVSDKGVSIWDTFSHTPGKILDGSTGDVACDSYHLYNEDIKLLKQLGVTHYRFSISWSRILPNASKHYISQSGVAYYTNLIKALKNAQITPIATLYHWDLPQVLQDSGGWYNDSIVTAFNDFAAVCFEKFGNEVKTWLTFNEPWVFVWIGTGVGVHAPGTHTPATVYTAAHNVIKSHAMAYHTYNDTYKATQGGNVSIVIDSDWKEAKDQNNQTDVEAAKRGMEFKLGWFANPIFVNGDYPAIMKEKVAQKSREQGCSKSRLPAFTEQEKQFIKGTHDFFGLNHYTTKLVMFRNRSGESPSYESDADTYEYSDSSWPGSGSSWLKVVPEGMRKLLVYVKDNYGNPPIYITENGVADINGTLHDPDRIEYYKGYINNVLKAIRLDGCNVVGYTAWSLMDNFEWNSGYTQRFGMFWVNFTDNSRPRTAKASAVYYSKIIKDNGFIKPNSSAGCHVMYNVSVIILLILSLKMLALE